MGKKGLVFALSLIVMLILTAPFIIGAPLTALANGEDFSETIYTAVAYADEVGGHVKIYAGPSESTEVITTVIDGTTLAVAETDVDGYHKVVLDDGIGYVKSENLTTSLSYNQRVALAIAIICVVAVALILLITYYGRNADYFKNKR